MLRQGLLMVLLAAIAVWGRTAVAEEGASDTGKLEKGIDELRRRYLAKLDAREEDRELRDAIRELNAAHSKGDWNRVAELLARHGIGSASGPGGGSEGGTSIDDLWPVRTSGQEGSQESKPGHDEERTVYDSAQGVKVGALIYRPRAASGKAPVVVLAHQGFRGIGLYARRLAEELAGVGYIVYMPELRGQGRSEGNVEYASGEILDVLAAIDQVKQLEKADAGRIGLVGIGHGGAAVLIALARAEGIKCASAISPHTDLTELAKDPVFTRELRLFRVPVDSLDAEALRRRSPLYYAGGIQVPVQVLHGARDYTVPVRYAEQYESALKQRGKEIELVRYELSGADLVEDIPVYRIDLQNFLAKHLKPPGWKVTKTGSPGGKEGQAGGGRKDETRPERERRRRH